MESKKKLQLIGVFEREKTVQYSLTLECIRQTATAFNEAVQQLNIFDSLYILEIQILKF